LKRPWALNYAPLFWGTVHTNGHTGLPGRTIRRESQQPGHATSRRVSCPSWRKVEIVDSSRRVNLRRVPRIDVFSAMIVHNTPVAVNAIPSSW